MGFFNSMKVIGQANDILRRLEDCFRLIEININSGNYSTARVYCNEAASKGREFLETVQKSHVAELCEYKFNGYKFKVIQLAGLFHEALQSADDILKLRGY